MGSRGTSGLRRAIDGGVARKLRGRRSLMDCVSCARRDIDGGDSRALRGRRSCMGCVGCEGRSVGAVSLPSNAGVR